MSFENYFLNKLIKNSKTQAPPAAMIICQSRPPPPIPNFPASQPPKILPIIPTMILPNRPKPLPFQSCPANHPEMAPIKRKYKNYISLFFISYPIKLVKK